MNLTSIRSIRPMTPIKNVSLNREVLIQRWQRQLIGRTDISFHEFLHLLRQHV
jgi:predicted NACHT family NTPase